MAIIDFKATKCRHCYKCVRNCEVKAIMVKDGQCGRLCRTTVSYAGAAADLPTVGQDPGQ